MAVEKHTDSEPLATGTQKGQALYVSTKGAWLYDPKADFRSCGVVVGAFIENETTGASGVINSVTEDTIWVHLSGGSATSFSTGDTYNIYKTDEKDSAISSIHTDRMYGRKIFKRSEVNERGHFPKDEDLDADRDHVFGPLQPERPRRY